MHMRGAKITRVKYKQHVYFLWKNGRSITHIVLSTVRFVKLSKHINSFFRLCANFLNL